MKVHAPARPTRWQRGRDLQTGELVWVGLGPPEAPPAEVEVSLAIDAASGASCGFRQGAPPRAYATNEIHPTFGRSRIDERFVELLPEFSDDVEDVYPWGPIDNEEGA